MIEKVCQTIEKYNLLEKGDRVVVALSGGPDSTALLAVLAQISRNLNLTLIPAHFNHGLRGKESDGDEKFSRNLAKKMGFVFCSEKMNNRSSKKGISPEDFYRRQRYNFLNKVAKDHRAQKIAMGHNLNDQAETVLLNLLRGTGLEGLKGFLPKRDGIIIRPLMEISRQEIISFLDKSEIAYCRDSSNENRMYLRNQIRFELIPYLREKYNPKIEENLARLAEILRVEDEFIQNQVAQVLRSEFVQSGQNRVLLKRDFLNELSTAIRWRLFKTILENFSLSQNGISFAHVKLLDNLTQKNKSGKRVILPRKIEARREYDNLILEKTKAHLRQVKYRYVMNIPGTLYIKERNIKISAKLVKKEKIDFSDKNKVYLDRDKIKLPLVIRSRKDGDWFQPLGMAGRQKIKNFFIDHKIPSRKRDEMMLIVDRLSVIYIENMHLSDRVKITAETKKVIKIEIANR
ncbi:MAG: tRNA lysidine(34) synthetase TilS [Syntrophaceae bacterium]|nr:tRNA lysidine(34) synthetase TilS [Syntrophaceae bacterium]